MDKIVSLRKNDSLFSIFVEIQEYQEAASRSDIINAAIARALIDRENGLNWKDVAGVKYSSVVPENADFPAFVQLRVDEEGYDAVVEQVNADFKLEKSSTNPYVVKLLLVNYLFYLRGKTIVKKNKHKADLLKKFKGLSTDDKLDAIYELLLDIKLGD